MLRVKKAAGGVLCVKRSHKESLLYGWEESPTECSFLLAGCPITKLTLQSPQQLGKCYAPCFSGGKLRHRAGKWFS